MTRLTTSHESLTREHDLVHVGNGTCDRSNENKMRSAGLEERRTSVTRRTGPPQACDSLNQCAVSTTNVDGGSDAEHPGGDGGAAALPDVVSDPGVEGGVDAPNEETDELVDAT